MLESRIKAGRAQDLLVLSSRPGRGALGIGFASDFEGRTYAFDQNVLNADAELSTIQDLLGHASIKTTQIYTKITTTGATSIRSPLDHLRLA